MTSCLAVQPKAVEGTALPGIELVKGILEMSFYGKGFKMAKVFLLLPILISFAAQAIEVRRGDQVEVSGKLNEILFAAGETVRSNANSVDDIFLAGGDVAQSGNTQANLFIASGKMTLENSQARTSLLAGGDLDIRNAKFQDLIAAGGNIKFDQSTITDDLIIAGGRLEIGPGSVINGSSSLAGGEIFFSGKANEDVQIRGGEVTLTGTFAKNLKVQAEKLVVGPNTRIQGNFQHSVQELNLSPSAVILGQNEALTGPAPSGPINPWTIAIFGLLFLLGVLLPPPLIATLFPKFISQSSNLMRTRFLESIGLGVLIAVLSPILIAVLFMTVVGVPLALFAIPFFIVATMVAWSIAVFTAGLQVRAWLRQMQRKEFPPLTTERRLPIFGWSFAGAVALLFLFMVPVVGFVLCLVLLVSGLGSIWMQLRGYSPRSRPESKTVISGAQAPA